MLICNKYKICEWADECRHAVPHLPLQTFAGGSRDIWSSEIYMGIKYDCDSPCGKNGKCEEELIVAMKEAIHDNMVNNNPNDSGNNSNL